ncbi:hypothetical protein V6Z11_A08G279100 [Gossypium hirsutum]
MTLSNEPSCLHFNVMNARISNRMLKKSVLQNVIFRPLSSNNEPEHKFSVVNSLVRPDNSRHDMEKHNIDVRGQINTTLLNIIDSNLRYQVYQKHELGLALQ